MPSGGTSRASTNGFDDEVMKRCAVEHLVGVRVVRRLATTGPPRTETVEIAMDFLCNKLFIVHGGERGSERRVHATHFDPSRAAWIGWAKRALPEDREIAALR
jgi:hypothetical protein